MTIKFENPLERMVTAAQKAFPELRADIQIVSGLIDETGNSGETHQSLWDEGERPFIQIDASHSVEETLSILAHELAHAAAGPTEESHGEDWERCFREIMIAYSALFGQPFDEEGFAAHIKDTREWDENKETDLVTT